MQADRIPQIKQKMDQISREILEMVRGRLLLSLPFLGTAIGRLKMQSDDMVFDLATDGQKIYYAPSWVIETYRASPAVLRRAYLHTVLHCIFQHPFVDVRCNQLAWDTAADIAVEAVIQQLEEGDMQTEQTPHAAFLLRMLSEKVRPLTAEKIYAYLQEQAYQTPDLERLRQSFVLDRHLLWWPEESSSAQEPQANTQTKALKKEWEEIAQMMDVDLDTLSKEKQKSDILTQNLKSLTRDKYDYRQFRRKFAVRGEDLKINDDEFDYIYYTYGLTHYGNMPLVEPLEYQDIQKIAEFVIAIDTSGSVKGELVQRFLDKTYSILHMEETFFSKMDLKIILCDDQIQDVAHITSQEEFDKYLRSLQMKGFGGTDFRPVFDLVEHWIEEKEFHHFKGLIYFTDGYGRYPQKPPSFDAAFIYLGYDPERPAAPPWAMKLVLEENQLAEDLK